MSFQSISFLAFLAVTAALCPALARHAPRAGQLALAAACIVFYLAGGGWAGLLVLAAGTTVTALCLRQLRGEDGPARRRLALVLGCGYHIAVLMAFKYTGFFSGGQWSMDWAPLGLSFFTFQQLWLLKEAHARQYVPQQGDDLLLYVFFFPTVTSGPILRPGAFFPQLRGEGFLRPDWEDIAAGLYAICCGLAKKTLLADPLGAVAANGWAGPGALSAPEAWLVMLAYTLQLYLDFSGYCDVAAGCARLLGVKLPVNFDSPYRSLSVGEFWKRWHITLTTFLRECLYIPLGGSRRGRARTYLNILLVFLASGFWHGAGWTFLAWGGLHGLAQVLERAWGPGRERLPKALRWGMTFLFVNVAWVFFRAPSLSAAGSLLASAVSGGWGFSAQTLSAGVLESETTALTVLLPGLSGWVPTLALGLLLAAALTVSLWPRNVIQRMEEVKPAPWLGAALAVLLVWCVLSFNGVSTFIYADF